MLNHPVGTLMAIVVASSAMAAEPIVMDGSLVYPEGLPIPSSMTPIELEWTERHPLGEGRVATAPPVGQVRCASEYEPMGAILLAWEGGSSYTNIVRQMAVAITTIGEADVFVACDSTSEANSVRSTLSSYGADMDRVYTVVRNTDTVWIRDYGPRYIYIGGDGDGEGACRAIVDHVYNRPRPNDNAYSSYFKDAVGHAFYAHDLVHGGGNYHVNSTGVAAATELILNENPGLNQDTIVDIWRTYQNVETYIHDAFPTSVDATQHIDMWMQIVGDTEIIISDWPSNSGSTQDQICDGAASYYQGLGWTVHRTPAFVSGWTHWTYTNMVLCNDLVLLPKYDEISNTYDTQALNVVQAAMPDRQVVQITCDNLAYSAGVMHCICMHMPAHSGGIYPTTCVQAPSGGSYDPGDTILVEWISDDDKFNVVNVDIELSTDGGSTWSTLSSMTADDGNYSFAAPDVATSGAVVRVLARDGDGNLGGDMSTAFAINGNSVPGDIDGDGICNVNDILALVASWGPCSGACPADLDGDGTVGVDDVLLILNYFEG
ncbi:MAG: agmatine deiminase family protein [Phycisphaerales bacterium]|nr:agmatine deiminase family protein [Phycisphaerales bacterium]